MILELELIFSIIFIIAHLNDKCKVLQSAYQQIITAATSQRIKHKIIDFSTTERGREGELILY